MWRSLSGDEKQEYVLLALREEVDPTPPRKRRRIAGISTTAIDVTFIAPHLETQTEDAPQLEIARPYSPQLWIVPRGVFGTRAADASKIAFTSEIISCPHNHY
jgi:hypothetical protein